MSFSLDSITASVQLVFKNHGELRQLRWTKQADNDLDIRVENVRHTANVTDRKRVGCRPWLRFQRMAAVFQQFLFAFHLSPVVETFNRLVDVLAARLDWLDGTRPALLVFRRGLRGRRRRGRLRRLVEDVVDAGNQRAGASLSRRRIDVELRNDKTKSVQQTEK